MDIKNNDNGQLTTFIPERPSDIAEITSIQDLLCAMPSIIKFTVEQLMKERPSDIAEEHSFQDLLEPLPSIIPSIVKKLKEDSPELNDVEVDLGYRIIPNAKVKIKL